MNKTKKIILLASLALIAVGVVGGTLAFLLDTAGPVENTFEPTYVPIEVEEDFDGETKKDVTIRNTGNIPAYIRATYVVNWATETGEIWGTPPTEKQYTITIGENWEKKTDNFWYYKSEVAAGATTYETGNNEADYFIISCSKNEGVENPIDANGNVYYLCVDVLAQSVQSEPKQAMIDLWKVDPSTLGN